MNKLRLIIWICLSTVLIDSQIKAQTVVATYPFPNYSQYNSFWGITKVNDTLRIATDNNGSIYKVSSTGVVLDSIATPFNFNHGIVWDGSGFWIAQDFRSSGAKLYKITTQGQRLDSIQLPSLIGGASGGVGDIHYDGSGIWFSIYSPDFTVYPFAYAYRIDLTSRQITDTIPLRGRQVQGITMKGDTIFYVNDYFHTTPFIDVERIYAYRKSTGDTLFSFAAPDPDGDCNPRGMHWDGQFLWLIADRTGGTANTYRTLYKYSITGAGNPQITTSSNSIGFGNVVIGTTFPMPLNISNTGTGKLIITNFQMTNSVFSIDPNIVPDTINPGSAKQYTVKFTPSAFDTVSGQLRIASNDGVTPVKIVSLRGKGIYSGSYISSSVPSINYSTRRMNSLCGGYFSLLNKGTTPLVISSVNFNSPRFRLDTTGITFPITIDTQKTKQFRIWFNPNSAGNFTDTAKINSNAVNNPQFKLSLSGTGQNNPTNLGDIFWQAQVPDNPNTSSDNFKIVSMKEISDVNADGINDVVVSTDNYWTICYNGNSSVTDDILWLVNTRTSSNVSGSVVYEDGMQTMDDINGDGVYDVVIGTGGNNELVYAISGRTGAILWTYGDSSITSDGDINGLSVLKDYNNDGKKDVLVAATGEGQGNGRHSVFCLNAVNGSVIFGSQQNGEFTHSTTSTTVGGAIDFSSNGGPYGINGFNNSGGTTWTYPTNSTVWNLKEMPDINTDGVSDIAGFVGFGGITFIISGSSGALIWQLILGQSIDGNIRLTDDLNNNGFDDMILSGTDILYRIDIRTSEILWSNPLDGIYIHGVDDLNDLTGDGNNEIVAGTQNSNIYVVTGDSGRTIFSYNFGAAVTNTVEQVSGLKSVDGNPSSEFLGGSRTGKLICFSGGPNGTIGVHNISLNVPDNYSLSQNYPNPFNPLTRIKFEIPKRVSSQMSDVKLVVYDALGKEVQTLVNEKLSAGSYEVEFEGSNFSSGVYFYRLEAGNFSNVRRMILLK